MARKSRKNLPETPLSIPNLYISTALYIRLSVEDNQGRGNSIENQQLILDDYIIDKPEFKVYNTYVDNGLTGTNFERPAFQRMLSDIEAGHIRCVIVKDLSRLGRNAIDAGYYIEQYFSQHNVRFIAITDGYDTADSSTTNGIILPLKNMINEAYAIDIGRKIKAQAHQAMLDGDFIGARAPFGYRKAPDNCHKLLIDEETAPIVRQIFEWAADGVGITTIVVRLNTMKITTLSKYKTATTEANKHYKQGEYWQTRTILRMLENAVYMGDMVQGKSKTVEHQQRRTTADNYIIVRDTHEPIVSRELFEKVQRVRKEICDEYKAKEIDHYTPNIFKGKVFCADCGRPLHRQRAKRKTKEDIYRLHCLANTRIASEIFNVNPNSWIDSLNTYQKNIINQLYAQTNDYELVANKWLTASIPTNVPFGTQKNSTIFFEKVLDEIEAFFSGDEKYKDSRLAILKESGVVQSYIVGGISIALAPVLGTSAPFLAPVIAIVLLTISKIGLNAWLATRREKREKENDSEE